MSVFTGRDKSSEDNRIYAPKEKANTCCWLCKKAIDGCSWSRDGQPVDGWKAVRQLYGRSKESTNYTYKIYFCPEFEEGDAAKGRKLNGAGIIKLWETVVAGIGEECRKAVAEVVRAQDELMSEACTVQRRNYLLNNISHGKGVMAMYRSVLGENNCLILQAQAIEALCAKAQEVCGEDCQCQE